jgi:hypothetical protein
MKRRLKIAAREEKLKTLRFGPTRPELSAKPFVACVILLFVAVVSACAQDGGISAGGKWLEFDSQDQMALVKTARFELEADNALPGSDSTPKILLFCTGGKLTLSDFRPNARIAPPNRPGFWGQPQMEVLVRVDESHSRHGWNWVNGHFLSMDKGTTRELIGAKVFKVEVATPQGPQIAEFSPAGINLDRVSKACGLTPKKP